jgi:hypothetical protein
VGWTCLRFTITDPQQYQYEYSVDGTTGAGKKFYAIARGDLDGDTVTSSFHMEGKIQPATEDFALFVSPNLIETNPQE